MANHRYWRVYVTATVSDGAGYLSCLELELRSTYGGSQQASGGTAFASSTGFGWVAAGAFDGSTSEPNGWHSGSPTVPQWIGYDFGASSANWKDIVQIWWMARFGQAQEPQDFELQYSDDNSTYTTVWSVTGAVFPRNSGANFATFPASPPSSHTQSVVFVST